MLVYTYPLIQYPKDKSGRQWNRKRKRRKRTETEKEKKTEHAIPSASVSYTLWGSTEPTEASQHTCSMTPGSGEIKVLEQPMSHMRTTWYFGKPLTMRTFLQLVAQTLQTFQTPQVERDISLTSPNTLGFYSIQPHWYSVRTYKYFTIARRPPFSLPTFISGFYLSIHTSGYNCCSRWLSLLEDCTNI